MVLGTGRKAVFLLHVVAAWHGIESDAGKSRLHRFRRLPLFRGNVRQHGIVFLVVTVHIDIVGFDKGFLAPVRLDRIAPAVRAVGVFGAHMVELCCFRQFRNARDMGFVGIAGIGFLLPHVGEVECHFIAWGHTLRLPSSGSPKTLPA